MNVYRAFADQTSDDHLSLLWDEIVAWETTGRLPYEARLRQFVRDAFDFGASEPIEDMGMNALQCQFASHEVWREIAARATGRKQ